MSAELHVLEESLKEFLCESQNGGNNSKNANLYKYNNLKIFMEPAQNKTPHFIVRIGISEAMYNIQNGEKLAGGLGSDERIIRKWFDKSSNKTNLNTAWQKSSKFKTVTMKEELDD